MAIQMAAGMGGVAFILLIALFSTGATAQSSDDCTNVIISMSPCLNYITGNSSFPSAGCCTQLGTVVQNKPQCLCQVLNGGASNLGLNINQTQARALPAACKVQTPPTSSCNSVSPSGSPTGTSGSPNTGSGGGSKSTPSGATSNKFAAPLVFFLPLVASYVSTFISC